MYIMWNLELLYQLKMDSIENNCVVEELIEAHFAKYIYHINMPLLFLQIWFSQRRKFYDLKLKKKMNDMLYIHVLSWF